MIVLNVDSARHDGFAGATGIYVRARRENKWGSFDIAQLDKESMHAFASSRGEVSGWALSILDAVLGYRDTGL